MYNYTSQFFDKKNKVKQLYIEILQNSTEIDEKSSEWFTALFPIQASRVAPDTFLPAREKLRDRS